MIAPASRYPTDPRAVFILVLCVVSGAPLVFGGAEPASLESLLPGWVIVLWGSSLVVGAVLTLVGMSRQSVNGILLEQIGSVIVGGVCVFYAAAIYLSVGFGPGRVAIAIVLGWGLSSFYRWLQLQRLLDVGHANSTTGAPGP